MRPVARIRKGGRERGRRNRGREGRNIKRTEEGRREERGRGGRGGGGREGSKMGPQNGNFLYSLAKCHKYYPSDESEGKISERKIPERGKNVDGEHTT